MRDCKKFCRPNLVKYPKDGDIIIRLQNGQTGIVNAKEYERIKKYFKKISDYDSSSNDEQNEGGGGAEPASTLLAPFSGDDMVLITDSESSFYNQKVGTKIVDGERKVIVCGFKGEPSPMNDECIVVLLNTDGRLQFEAFQVINENVETYEELLEVVSGYFNLPVYEYGYYDTFEDAYRQIESICSNFDNILFYGYPEDTSNGRWLVRILNGEMYAINWQNIANVGIKRVSTKYTGNTNMPASFRQLSPDNIEITDELNYSITIGSDTVTFVDGSPSVQLTQWH